MSVNLVRCAACYEVVDPSLGTCPNCGYLFPPPAIEPQERAPSFADRYREVAPVAPVPLVAPTTQRQSWATLMIGLGIVLVVVVAFAAAFVMLNPGGDTGPTQNMIIRGPTPTVTPPPTLPPGIAATLAQLNDPHFSAKLTVLTTYTLDAKVTGHSVSAKVRFEGQLSAADESGTFTVAGQRYEFRIVGGVYYERIGSGRWNKRAVPPAHIAQPPLFDVTQAKQLQYVADDVLSGAIVHHLRTTKSWQPDFPRIALLDRFDVNAAEATLDLWVSADGTPVRGVFTATTDAADGTHLMIVESDYDFANVGTVVTIAAPK